MTEEEEQPYVNRSIRREFQHEANKNRRKNQKKQNKKARNSISSAGANKKKSTQPKNKQASKNEKKDTNVPSTAHATGPTDRNLLSKRAARSIRRMSEGQYTTALGNHIDDIVVGILEDGNITKATGKIVYDSIFTHTYKILDQNKNIFNTNKASCQKTIQPIAKYASNKISCLVHNILDGVETTKMIDKSINEKKQTINSKEGDQADNSSKITMKSIAGIITHALMISFSGSKMFDTLMNAIGESLAKLLNDHSILDNDDAFDKNLMSSVKDAVQKIICEVAFLVVKSVAQGINEVSINYDVVNYSDLFVNFLVNSSHSKPSKSDNKEDQEDVDDIAKQMKNVRI